MEACSECILFTTDEYLLGVIAKYDPYNPFTNGHGNGVGGPVNVGWGDESVTTERPKTAGPVSLKYIVYF